MKVKVKPLSVNRAWQGRRFKTPEYKTFEEEMFYGLPKFKVPEGKLFVRLVFGLSNKGNDIDNAIKPTLDCLQNKYGFNDKKIYGMEVWKEDTKKGEEYIDFDIWSID